MEKAEIAKTEHREKSNIFGERNQAREKRGRGNAGSTEEKRGFKG